MRRYEPLVQRVVWKLRLPRGCEREDLAQEARVGLLAAIRAWRPERGPFPAFADRCVIKPGAARPRSRVRAQAPGPQPRASRSTRRWTGAPDPARRPAAHQRCSTRSRRRRDTRTDPELRLLVREQLTSVLRALPTLTDERARRARDGAERTEPHAARLDAPRLAARGIAGGPPRAPQARRRPRAGRLTQPARSRCDSRHGWHDVSPSAVRARVDVVRRTRPARSRRCSTAAPSTAGSAGCRAPPRCRSRCPRPRCRRARRWRRS